MLPDVKTAHHTFFGQTFPTQPSYLALVHPVYQPISISVPRNPLLGYSSFPDTTSIRPHGIQCVLPPQEPPFPTSSFSDKEVGTVAAWFPHHAGQVVGEPRWTPQSTLVPGSLFSPLLLGWLQRQKFTLAAERSLNQRPENTVPLRFSFFFHLSLPFCLCLLYPLPSHKTLTVHSSSRNSLVCLCPEFTFVSSDIRLLPSQLGKILLERVLRNGYLK